MTSICDEQRKRQRVNSSPAMSEHNDSDTEVNITPPPSPSLEESREDTEIVHLKMELEKQKKETDVYKRDARIQRARNVALRDDLERVTKEKEILRERLIEEAKIRAGIRTTNALGPRLDDGDYKTICNNVKYLALKEESVKGNLKFPMVILTKSGVSYLKEKWGRSVNKNGERSNNKENQPATTSTERHVDAQRIDNDLINLILPFFTDPERNEPKPKRNPKNYLQKAQHFGYRGERGHFDGLDQKIRQKSEEVVNQLVHYKVFKTVKSVLDSKTSVTAKIY